MKLTLGGTPLVRDLYRCRRRDYAEAAKEVIGTLLFSLLPVWLGIIGALLITRGSVAKYLSEFLASGEGLLISAAIIGPSIYVITKKYGDLPKSLTIHFPQGWFLVLVSFTVCMLTGAIFSIQRTYQQLQLGGAGDVFDYIVMKWISVGVIVVTFSALYVVTVFRNFMEDGAASEMHSDTEEFLKKWEKSDSEGHTP